MKKWFEDLKATVLELLEMVAFGALFLVVAGVLALAGSLQ